jgi:hypothetical protein
VDSYCQREERLRISDAAGGPNTFSESGYREANMPTKKQGRKPASKPDADARIKDFTTSLRQYTDAKSFDISPENWPRIFPLKIGLNTVGQVSINWVSILGQIAQANKPQEVSDVEYIAALESATPEEQKAWALPAFVIGFHMLEHLPEKLCQAMVDLTYEGLIKFRDKHFKDQGIKYVDNPTELVRKVGDREIKRIKKRLGIGRGGVRDKKRFKDDIEVPLLVHFIDSVRPLWDYITEFFAKHHYDPDCVKWIKGKPEYNQLLKEFTVSDMLLHKVFRKKSESKPELEPLGFAVEQAREQLNIKWKHSTVTTHYKKAKAALKLSPGGSPTSN